MPVIDEEFTSLPLAALTDAALSTASRLGASWCDVRVSCRQERSVDVRDALVEHSATSADLGIGVRVIVNGAWGFASHSTLSVQAAESTAARAVRLARASASLVNRPVQLAEAPVVSGTWCAPYREDPLAVPDAQLLALMSQWSADLRAASGVDHSSVSFSAAKEQLYYADSAGSVTTQQRVRCHPWAQVVAVTDQGFQDMATTIAPRARGWEYLATSPWSEQLAELPGLLAERVAAPPLAAGRYDLIIAPSNLWLTIHESVGHATEFDRAEGYEANYAGTSFAVPGLLGQLQYGSPLMTVTGDRVTPDALSTVRWDEEGVAATTWDLVREGVLVGYQLDRWGAARLGLPASNGCAYADRAGHVQLQRMPNVSLQPQGDGPDLEALIAGVTDGLLVVGDKSWSIDMNRRNFQFTAQRFLRVQHGRITGQVRDVAYQSDTLSFWRSLVALGGPQTYELGGALNCGKGQPGQVAPVSHGCPAAVFEGVNVLSTGGDV